MNMLYVAAGGAIGAALRYGIGKLIGVTGFPIATLSVNLLGSLAMGVFIGWMAQRSAGASQALHLFMAIGVFGSFTTFSSFSLDVITLYERGEMMSVLSYVLASVTLSVLALFGGLWMMRAL